MQNPQFSNMQLELLNLFNRDISDEDLKAIKRLITKYLAEKLSLLADKVWEDKGLTNQDMETLLHTHLRTPYKP